MEFTAYPVTKEIKKLLTVLVLRIDRRNCFDELLMFSEKQMLVANIFNERFF